MGCSAAATLGRLISENQAQLFFFEGPTDQLDWSDLFILAYILVSPSFRACFQ